MTTNTENPTTTASFQEPQGTLTQEAGASAATAFVAVEATNAALVRAGFWRRAAASIIDAFVISTLFLPLTLVTTPILIALGALGDPKTAFLITFGRYLLSLLGTWTYAGLMLSKKGATLGKMAMKLKVLDIKTGGYPPFMQGALREVCKTLSALILMLGFLMAAFGTKRALHDYVFDTVVIKKNS